ncbi:MAG: CAP domain-containing protein [Polaromonas sp.]|nr:CAP domain-containing protein [Polaromonas sp.]
MNMTRFFWLPAVACCALLAVAGCGGGGDDGDDAASSADARVPALVASSYAAGSEELAAFNLLNAERARCGFGTLAQSAQLDAAATGHADYQSLNNLFTHVQDPVAYPSGFTGEVPSDRVAAAGYPGAGVVADEIVRFVGATRKDGLGTRGVRDLLSAPYHLRGLMGGYRDVGVSVRSSADVGSSAGGLVYLQINAAYKDGAGPQSLAAGEVSTYPCEGTTGVNRQLRNETPNPVPGRDLAVNPLGAVVYVAVREGNTLRIRSAVMTEVQTGRTVTLRPPVTAGNDPHGPCQEGCFEPHQGYLAADAPLLANAPYQVVLNGSSNGVAFNRVFTFVTGSGG